MNAAKPSPKYDGGDLHSCCYRSGDICTDVG